VVWEDGRREAPSYPIVCWAYSTAAGCMSTFIRAMEEGEQFVRVFAYRLEGWSAEALPSSAGDVSNQARTVRSISGVSLVTLF